MLNTQGVIAESTFHAPPACALKRLSLGYGASQVVYLEELSVGRGEVVAVVGRSGIGKTTLLAAISGALEPQSGEILLEGRTEPAMVRRQRTARTIQSFPLLHWLTVRGNMHLACKMRRVPATQVDGILEEFSALHLGDRYPRNLSGGERCRASLAQAVIAKPAVLLLDEPFTGLDTLVKKDVAAALFEFSQRNQTGVLFVTHDLYDAVDLSDRVVVLGGVAPAVMALTVSTSTPQALELVRNSLREER